MADTQNSRTAVSMSHVSVPPSRVAYLYYYGTTLL